MLSSHLTGFAHSLVPLGKRAMMEMHGSQTESNHMVGSGGHMSSSSDTGTMITVGKDGGKPDQIQLPGWFFLACLAVAVAVLPAFLFISYTLNNMLPALAMMEDPAPPAYEPLSNSADADADADADAEPETGGSSGKPGPVTASVRRTTCLLRSICGIRSYFRGFWCAIVASVAISIVQSFFAAFIPTRVLSALISPLPALLITIPINTAWTHIVMSGPRPNTPWYRRLPPTAKTFSALWRPALVMWAAVTVCTGVPRLMLLAFGVADEIMSQDPNMNSLCWKIIVTALVGLVLCLALVIPAHVVFIRVQASLLPLEDEPIIAFDRSFGGAIPPEIVGGQGYATLADAWRSFSKEAWTRLIKLYGKLVAINLAFWAVLAAVMVPLYLVARKHATVVPAGGN